MVVDVENIPCSFIVLLFISAHVPFCSCYCHRWGSQLSLENRNAILLVWNHDNLKSLSGKRRVRFFSISSRLGLSGTQIKNDVESFKMVSNGVRSLSADIPALFIPIKGSLLFNKSINVLPASVPSICSLSVGAVFQQPLLSRQKLPPRQNWLPVIPERF